jgi:uncharacterized membrane protein
MRLNWRLEALQLAAIVAMYALAAWAWPQTPERIPVHWNLQGEVDGYGGRFLGLMLVPLLASGFYVLMLVLPRIDPGRRNYQNFAKAYGLIRVTFIAYLTAIQGVLVAAALGHKVDVGLVISLMVAALLAAFGNLMGKIRPNWFVGVRTPWTLSSKLSWNKTHQLAGWLFILMAAAVALAGIIRTGWMLAVMLTVIGGSLLWLVIYSYLVYRRDPERLSPAGVTPAEE